MVIIMESNDKVKIAGVTISFLKMKRFGIAALEQAYAG